MPQLRGADLRSLAQKGTHLSSARSHRWPCAQTKIVADCDVHMLCKAGQLVPSTATLVPGETLAVGIKQRMAEIAAKQ